jgi:hypothetical protein
MARNLNDIKTQITNKYVSDMATIGYTINAATWSVTNLQRLFIYVVAYCIFILENLWDTTKTEITDTIKRTKKGSKSWYKEMVLYFQFGYALPIDSDEYDNTNVTQAQVDASKIVKYCAVTDRGDIVTIKVAKDTGDLTPLNSTELAALQSYIQKIKYGGVFISIVNEEADSLIYTASIHYKPMLLDSNGVNISSGVETVKQAINNYLKTLEFNGEFSPQSLQDAIQKVEGVVYVTPTTVQVKASVAAAYEPVETYYIPASGYLRFLTPTNLTLHFIPYAN